MLEDAIKKIIESIQVDHYFDSHFIIQELIKNHSDEYLKFASKYKDSQDITTLTHSQIGFLVKSLCKNNIIEQAGKSWSTNIHGKNSSCTMWKRI